MSQRGAQTLKKRGNDMKVLNNGTNIYVEL